MSERVIHHTRSIRTNSAINLSLKPGLELCCDLLQHLQEVPRTCILFSFDMMYTMRTFILLVPSLELSSYEMCEVTLGVISVSLLR